MIVGEKNRINLPHMRCHCTLKPFNLQNTRDENNKKTCEQCFCYVCDKKAGECESWGGSHYRACDQGAEKFYWRTGESASVASAEKRMGSMMIYLKKLILESDYGDSRFRRT